MTASDTAVFELSQLDRERHLCALCAPRDRQAGLMALIAYNDELARIPDNVSDPMLGKIKLQWWIDVVPGILQGRSPSHPVAQGLSAVRDVLQNRASDLRLLAEGRNFDLEPDRPTSLDDLVAYAESTGGVLHALMLDVLGVEDEQSVKAAKDIGTAWTLIGVMRALPYAGACRRDMLPVNAEVQDVIERARDLLARGRSYQASRAALPALLIARLAERHIRRLEKQNWNPASREEPPAGVGAVLSVWWGKLSRRY